MAIKPFAHTYLFKVRLSFCNYFNSLPNDKNLDLSKLKAFADEK